MGCDLHVGVASVLCNCNISTCIKLWTYVKIFILRNQVIINALESIHYESTYMYMYYPIIVPVHY